jgi:hypothetical protein
VIRFDFTTKITKKKLAVALSLPRQTVCEGGLPRILGVTSD